MKIKPKLILGLMLLFVLSSCSAFQKNKKSNARSDDDTLKKGKMPKATCYCPSF